MLGQIMLWTQLLAGLTVSYGFLGIGTGFLLAPINQNLCKRAACVVAPKIPMLGLTMMSGARRSEGGWGESDREMVPRKDRKPTYSRGDTGDQPVQNEAVIYEMLAARERARRNRDFEAADQIRDQMLFEHGVHVDDQSK